MQEVSGGNGVNLLNVLCPQCLNANNLSPPAVCNSVMRRLLRDFNGKSSVWHTDQEVFLSEVFCMGPKGTGRRCVPLLPLHPKCLAADLRIFTLNFTTFIWSITCSTNVTI